MAHGKVTIKKRRAGLYEVNIGGQGMTVAYTKKEARKKQRAFQRQLGRI